MSTPEHALLERIRERASARGLNLSGALCGREFDLCQPKGRRCGELLPGCGTILVIASGGRSFWEDACAGTEERDAQQHVRAAVSELVDSLAGLGWSCRSIYPDDQPSLNFVQLGEMAGLGTVSPVVGMLINPSFGLWVRFRAAVLVAGQPFGTDLVPQVPPTFQPCATCNRPCVTACPANVYDENGTTDIEACATHRHRGGCIDTCEARRACPIGDQALHGSEEETQNHQANLSRLRRYFGKGGWRVVPGKWRRRS